MNVKFSIKHIADRASVSKATVDRVINGRPGVSLQTRQRVLNARDELEKYHTQINLSGKQVYIDFLIHKGYRRTDSFEDVVLRDLSLMQPSNINPRFHFLGDDAKNFAQRIDHIVDSGTSGLVLTAMDERPVRTSINQAYKKGIPVVTFDSDVSYSDRIGFIGAKHFSNGQAAAYLISQWLKPTRKQILVSILDFKFCSQLEAESGFRYLMRQQYPDAKIDVVNCGSGSYTETYDQVKEYFDNDGEACSVYSIGGDNGAIRDAFERYKRAIDIFIGHSLNKVNKSLLLQDKINVILDHNIEHSIYHCFQLILKFHEYIPTVQPVMQNHTSIITAFNLLEYSRMNVTGAHA